MAVRQLFSSRVATLLTMVGVAVGLGNVWRFPYMMGQFGGSAFLVVYLAFVVLFATPALMGEWALGRATRRGPLGALTAAFGPSGRLLGIILLVTVFVANSYYIVVIANVAFTAGFSVFLGFNEATLSYYETGLNNGVLQASVGIVVIAMAAIVLHSGVQRGIERVSKLFVPFFGVVVVYLIVTALALPGAVTQLRDFLRPDFTSLTTTSVFAAMGQAFFSLSLGGTFYLIYGSYLRDEERIPSGAVLTASGDVGAALLASLFIVPATLVLGLDLETGPRLIFVTLPNMFAEIPGGRLSGTIFLIALWMMAFLSSIAAFQVVIGALVDSAGMALGKAVTSVAIAEAALMIPIAIWPQSIGVLDLIFGSGMQVLGSAITLVALAWGLGKAATLDQVFRRPDGFWPPIYYRWIKFVVPLTLLLTLVLFILDSV